MQRAFPFTTPVDREALIDRRAELHQLHLAAIDGAHVRVAGPRRYGKTSLLLAHEDALSQVGWRTLHVDLYGVTSLAEVCARIATSYAKLKDSRVRSLLDALSARLGLSLTTSGVGLTLGPRPIQSPSADATLTVASELLDLPVRLFERDGRQTLVVFDEFQDLLSDGATLDGLLRSHLQYHGDAATYIYAGSQPSLMRKLFTDRERPLYGQAEPLELTPLPVDEVQIELAERFEQLAVDPGGALGPLIMAADGHPQRTMLLAHLLHRELTMRESGLSTLSDAECDATGVVLAEAVLELAMAQTSEAHHGIWDSLSAGKKAVLAAMADDVRPTGSRATERSRLSRAALQSAVRDLAREGQHISRITAASRGSPYWRFVDPLFARWVRSRGHP